MRNIKPKKIYICLRLFNYNDKIQAELLEKELLAQCNITTFMPFRDTDENNLSGENRTRIIYDADIERLNSGEISATVALFDGVCKDEGISFELGYSFGKNIPTYAVNTDFIWYAIRGKEFLFDPVLEFMLNDRTHTYTIENMTPFSNALYCSQQKAFKEAACNVAVLIKHNHTSSKLLDVVKVEKQTTVTIDFGGGKYEYQRALGCEIKDALIANGITAVNTERFHPDNSDEILNRGLNDINKVYQSDIFLFLGDEIEVNSGTAALLGLARSLGKKCFMYESSDIEIVGENGHKMKKNLIIDFSIDSIIQKKDSIVDFIKKEVQHGQ